MTLWQIAARNVWQSRGRYLSYLGSAGFSVMVYFLYTALAMHPGLRSGFTGTAGMLLSQGMYAAAVVIAIFTFLFLLYANSAFVRSRMKEFGLLSLMGVTKRQLVAMVLWESLIVGAVALLGGLGLGVVFLKLFFMAISVLLDLPEQIPVYAGLPVWLQTLAVFGSFFVVVSLFSLQGILRRSVIELIRAARQPKAAPTFSRWKAALGVILVVGGYAWASARNTMVVVLGIIPVTTIVSVGTYFLLRESSIAVLQWLRRRERFFHRPGPFLNISQLTFKMQDNYRVLTDVAILVAVILTAMGTAATGFAVMPASAIRNNPHAVQLVRSGRTDLFTETDQVNAVLEEAGVGDFTTLTLQTRHVRLKEKDVGATLVPYSAYAAMKRPTGEELAIGPGEAVLIYPAMDEQAEQGGPFDDQVAVGDRSLTLHLLPNTGGRFFNETFETFFTLVLPDAAFAQLMEQTPESEQITVALWNTPQWQGRAMEQAEARLRSLFPSRYPSVEEPGLSTALEAYESAITSLGLVLFIGLFVSLVFFAACCSLIYFRLFTEIEEDRKYYRRLQQVGASDSELRRLARGQTMVIFSIPFVIGMLHSTFAMKALGTVLRQTVLQYGLAVAAAYFVLYVAYFGASYTAYWRAIRAGLGGQATQGA